MKVLILHGKHGISVFKANTASQKLDSAWKIFLENREYYSFPLEHSQIAMEIEMAQDRKKAWQLITERSDQGYEYELVDEHDVM